MPVTWTDDDAKVLTGVVVSAFMIGVRPSCKKQQKVFGCFNDWQGTVASCFRSVMHNILDIKCIFFLPPSFVNHVSCSRQRNVVVEVLVFFFHIQLNNN